jgi:hypothetical protein
VVTLQREPQNRLNRQVFAELDRAVGEAALAGVRSLLIRSAGSPGCAPREGRDRPSEQLLTPCVGVVCLW